MSFVAATEQAAITPDPALRALLQKQRDAFLSDAPVTLAQRHDRLDRAIAMLLAHRHKLRDAAVADFPGRGDDWTLLAEVFAPLQVFLGARKNVARWMRPERRKAAPPFNFFGARAEIQFQPLGVIGIMGAWNAPLNLVLAPLGTALAAGNRAMLCPSDMMPGSAAALDEAVREYFDDSEIAVVRGGLEVCKTFSHLQFDHLMFTGSPEVGSIVMRAAAPNLVPVTLELGGKCPVIVGESVDLEDTARRLYDAKMLNGGQACLAPDLLYVPEALLEPLIAQLQAAAAARYPNGAMDTNLCSIVNDRHFGRIGSMVDQARQGGARTVVIGADEDGEKVRNPGQRRMALHLIVNPPADSRAMHEEIFGPVLVVRSYSRVDDVCAQLRQMPKPLGLYVFAKDAAFRQYVLDRTFSGGVTLGDAMYHYSVPDLPFGGVGRSGIGAYSFGIEGFRRFSHARSVYRQAGPRALTAIMQPPYGRLFDWAIRSNMEKLAQRYASTHRPRR